jgi:hypothetical protein
MGRMLGVWLGRILEEDSSDKFNTELVGTAHKMWEDAKGTKREKEFVNVADPKHPDPVVRDAWGTLGWKIKAEAEALYGQPDTFMVRRDMINDMIGARAAGVTDIWTGISRLKPETQDAIRNLATAFMGKNAYKWLSTAEGSIQSLVSLAKATIIIRSIKVAVDNLSSNVVPAESSRTRSRGVICAAARAASPMGSGVENCWNRSISSERRVCVGKRHAALARIAGAGSADGTGTGGATAAR